MNFLKNRKIIFLLFIQLFVLSSMISSPITPTQAKTNTSSITDSQVLTSMQNADLVAIYDKNASNNIKIDGIMSPHEYPESFYSNYTGMTVAMAYNGTSMFVFVSAPTAGWVGVGFNDLGYGMVGGDLKVGWVNDYVPASVNGPYVAHNVNATIGDYYASGYTQPIQSPVDDIGANNGTQTLYVNGAQGVNTTNLEFVFPMNDNNTNNNPITTSPICDNQATGQCTNPLITPAKILTPGQSYSLLLAYGPNQDEIVNGFPIPHDSLGSKHVNKTIATLYIAPENILPRTDSKISFSLTQANGSGYTNDTIFTGTINLAEDNGTPIVNASVGIYQLTLIGTLNLVTGVTDANGQAKLNFTLDQEYSSAVYVQAQFLGNIQYKKANSLYSNFQFIGSVPTTQAPFLIIPTSFDFIVPWLTGFGVIATVGGIWMAFGFVIYTAIFKNAVQPNEKKSNKGN